MRNATIAVVHPTPTYRRGLATALAEEGFVVEEPADLLTWHPASDVSAAVLALMGAEEFRLLARLSVERPALGVVALVGTSSPSLAAEALTTGARTSVPEAATVADIVEAVKAAVDGKTLLPVSVARALASGSCGAPDGCISSREGEWLQLLASGMTTEQLADRVGYSQREMYRVLRRIYDRMGVKGRTAALVQAARWGLTDR